MFGGTIAMAFATCTNLPTNIVFCEAPLGSYNGPRHKIIKIMETQKLAGIGQHSSDENASNE